MALRNILTEENPALRKVCRPYTAFDGRLHQLLDDMKETLAQANGVGLAAPQVTYLLAQLAEEGFAVDSTAITVEEAKQSILAALHGQNRSEGTTI